MRIPLALLAEFALAHASDGKLYITGGGIRSLAFNAFPAVLPRLALAVGIEVADSEFDVDHSLVIEGVDEQGDAVIEPVRVTFNLQSEAVPEGAGYTHFVSNMENVPFARPGPYLFRISIDDVNLEELGLDIRGTTVIGRDIEAASRGAQQLVGEGYAAYVVGDVGLAETKFRDAIARYPSSPGGHNNLGFVLLTRLDANGAVSEFELARTLGFPQDEITDANVACANYVAGRHGEALAQFELCLRDRLFTVSATLFAIRQVGLASLTVDSAAGYAALIALNAAWCARSLGDEHAVTSYLALARAGLSWFNADARDVFQLALAEVADG